MKFEEKWKKDAIDLLLKNNFPNPEDHASIKNFNQKIIDLQNEIENFNGQSEKYLIFVKKHSKSHDHSTENKTSTTFKSEDRWADVKIENAMKREYNWLCRMDNYMPSYMKQNLENMPNNKGYIWKGIHYFGHLAPEEPLDTVSLFEKQNQKLYIHEYTKEYYRIFEKAEKTKPKVLIFEKLNRFLL
jgi:hypothetical protein